MLLIKHQIHKNQLFNLFTLSRGNLLISVAIFTCMIANGITEINAVPTDSTDGISRVQLLHRALRDVATIAASFMQDNVSKDTTFVAAPAIAALTSDEASSSVQPQGQCLLDGVLVSETSVVCKNKVGCRAIQKTGYCCPDYKCDCEKDGKSYLNGDKLVDPETPCTVCYCQGGEILCSPVSCFHRDDCTPKYIPGRCCPNYDNCPVSSPEPSTTTNRTISDALNSPTTLKPEIAAAFNPKITIKEITKPTEIRITDENKAIPIHQMLKPSTTEAAKTSTMATATASFAETTSTTESSNLSTTKALSEHESFRKDTNQKINSNNHKVNGGINTESLKLSASVAYSTTASPQLVSTTERNELKVHGIDGNNRHSGETPFAAFETEGLQRVEIEVANDPNSKVNMKREFLDSTADAPTASTSNHASDDYTSSELIYAQTPIASNEHTAIFHQSSAEATEPDTAGSDNIYHIIMTTDGPRAGSSTESYLALKGSISTEGFEPDLKPNSFNSVGSVVIQHMPSSTEFTWNEITSTTKPQHLTTKGMETASELSSSPSTQQSQPSTEGPNQHHMPEDEDSAIPIEANPAYPSLPEDDFSLRDVNFPLGEGDELIDEPRSIGGVSSYDPIKNTKQLDDALINMSGSGSGDNDVIMEPSTESSGQSMSTSSIIALMYSAEDGSEETAVSNASDFRLTSSMKESENETGSGESQELDSAELFLGSGSGGGNSDLYGMTKPSKKREYTTPRPTKKPTDLLDIDEIGTVKETVSPAEDPKLDVESLKLDEDQNDGNTRADAATKGDLLTVKLHPSQDKAIEEQLGTVGVADGEQVQRLLLQRIY